MTAILVLIVRISLSLALYAFLWMVFQSLWQELKHQGTALAVRKRPGIQVKIKTENGEEEIFRFQQDEIAIGRAPDNTININDDEALSANHARITYHHAQWWLEDAHSTNGTYLNNELIFTPAVVVTGDQFKCGNTIFVLYIDTTNNNETGG